MYDLSPIRIGEHIYIFASMFSRCRKIFRSKIFQQVILPLKTMFLGQKYKSNLNLSLQQDYHILITSLFCSVLNQVSNDKATVSLMYIYDRILVCQ